MPSGRPDIKYFLPNLYGTTDHMISIETAETDEFIHITNVLDHSDGFNEFADTLMNESNAKMPHDVTIGFQFYLYLLKKIEDCI